MDHSILIGRHTATQLAEILSSGVHLSMCFTVRKERASITNAMRWIPPPPNGTGPVMAVGKNRPMVLHFWVGKYCARTTPWFCGKILRGYKLLWASFPCFALKIFVMMHLLPSQTSILGYDIISNPSAIATWRG